MERAFDIWTNKWSQRLSALSRRSFALFFAYNSERLIPLYIAFANKHHWGDPSLLRHQLDTAWSVLGGAPIKVSVNAREALTEIAPHGDDFDSPDSTYAQDAVFCVDIALMTMATNQPLSGDYLYYAVEAIKTKGTLELSAGKYVSMEGSRTAEWETRLLENKNVASHLRDCENLIARLESTGAFPDIAALRAKASSNALNAEDTFPFRQRYWISLHFT